MSVLVREFMIPNSFQLIRCGGTIRELSEPQGLTAADSRGPAFLPLRPYPKTSSSDDMTSTQIECVDAARFFHFTTQMIVLSHSSRLAWYSTVKQSRGRTSEHRSASSSGPRIHKREKGKVSGRKGALCQDYRQHPILMMCFLCDLCRVRVAWVIAETLG
jgi:hypothetical protein